MDLFNTGTNQTLLPGQRLLKVKGAEAADKYPMPRDCEAAIFDEDDDYLYVKKTDTNGGVILLRYHLEEDPIPKFDPKKYVTVDDFSRFKEEILNGFNTLQQTITTAGFNGTNNDGSNKSSKQHNKPNNGFGQSAGNVSANVEQ